MSKRPREQVASLHFDPIVHAVSEFLLFQDCAAVASASKLFYSRVWVHLLTSCSRPLTLNNRIDVGPETVGWITKYSNSLQNQTVRLGTYFAIDFVSLGITRLHELIAINGNSLPELPYALRKLRLVFCDLDDLKTSTIPLPNIECFLAQLTITQTETSNLLHSLPSSLRCLKLFWISLDFSDCPLFPHVIELHLLYPDDACRRPLSGIQDKFPLLQKLHFREYECDQPVSLEPLAEAKLEYLVIVSNNLTDLTPLARIPTLRELDIRGCRNIVDFSPVRHVPIITANRITADSIQLNA
jgi:hypothetical protein